MGSEQGSCNICCPHCGCLARKDSWGWEVVSGLVEFKSWLKIILTTTPCSGCKAYVSRSYGCSHMTCTSCQEHFCYTCGHPIRKKNNAPSIHD